MTDKYLRFLDFVLQKLNEEYDLGDDILSIAYYYKKEKGIDFPEKDIQPFSDLYEGTYFKRISDISSIVKITPNAKEIIDTYESLSKYFEIISESQAREQAKLDDKEKLDTEIKKLQKENLEYQLTIREQLDRIRNLEEQNKFIELLKGYWWVFIICIGIGACLLKLWDRLMP